MHKHTSTVVLRSEGDPPHASAEVNRNYDGFGQAYNYFNSTFGWDSFDGAGAAIKSYIHWGTTPHAKWDKVNERFHFAGTDYTEADDLIGHEYAHAVIDHSVWNPTMIEETGAIAESMADLYGEFIDWTGGWAADPSGDDWLIDETLTGGRSRTCRA